MKLLWKISSVLLAVVYFSTQPARAQKTNRSPEFDLQSVLEIKLGEPTGQFRAVPVNLGGI